MVTAARKSAAIRVTSLTRPSDADWDAALAECERPFRFSHRSAAGRALEQAYPSYRFMPCRVVYNDGSTILYPLVKVQRRLDAMSTVVGMPFGWEGTPLPLSGTANAAHVRALFRCLDSGGAMEIYGGAGGSPPAVGTVGTGVTHALSLDHDFERVWNESFTAKNRNMCRKSERGGVLVTKDSSRPAIDAYYGLYEASTKAWGYETAPYPTVLFQSLLESGHAELWTACVDDRLIAGALLLRGSEDLLYWSGAMDRGCRQLAPSNAVLRAAIRAACERDFKYFDFGASIGLAGVEAFKRGFGAQPREYREVSLSSWRHRQLARAQLRFARVGVRT